MMIDIHRDDILMAVSHRRGCAPLIVEGRAARAVDYCRVCRAMTPTLCGGDRQRRDID
eukprot:COSAG01_NODE_23775_length_802_cov_1.189189_1_plen_58_part_00